MRLVLTMSIGLMRCIAAGFRRLCVCLVRVGMIRAGLASLVKVRGLGGLDRRLVLLALGLQRLGAHLIATAVFAPRTATASAAARAAVDLLLGVAMRALFLGDQRLPVRDRDLIIIGMNFRERQEPMAVAAVVDEGGLERRLYPRDLGEIDIAAQLATACRLEIELLDPIAAQHHHPGLLRMGGVDEHLVGHETVSLRARAHARRARCTGGTGRAPICGLNEWRRIVRAGVANAAALPTLYSPGRRGASAPCALSMILNLDLRAAALAHCRGFLRIGLPASSAGVWMSLKGVGRSAKAP